MQGRQARNAKAMPINGRRLWTRRRYELLNSAFERLACQCEFAYGRSAIGENQISATALEYAFPALRRANVAYLSAAGG
jgi:hypothetical protein